MRRLIPYFPALVMDFCLGTIMTNTAFFSTSLSLTASNVRIQSAASDYRQFVNNTLCIELADGDKIQPHVQHEEGSDQAHTFMNSLSSAHFSMFRLAGV